MGLVPQIALAKIALQKNLGQLLRNVPPPIPIYDTVFYVHKGVGAHMLNEYD